MGESHPDWKRVRAAARRDEARDRAAGRVYLPWERQSGEPPYMYRGFVCYRDMGEERTITGAHRAASAARAASPTSKGPASYTTFTWHAWSKRWDWEERAVAYDRHLERERVKGAERAIRLNGQQWVERGHAWREKQWQDAQYTTYTGRCYLAASLERVVRVVDGQSVEVDVPADKQAALIGEKLLTAGYTLGTAAVEAATKWVEAAEGANGGQSGGGMDRDEVEEAKAELREWQARTANVQNGLSLQLMPPTSSTPTA